MSKLEKAIDKLEQEVECDTCLVLINSLRKAIEQRNMEMREQYEDDDIKYYYEAIKLADKQILQIL